MFLKILEKLGRKKLIYDRGHNHPKYHEKKPWMNRYFLLFRLRPKWFPFNIIMHEMFSDDEGNGVHNHSNPFISIMLRGGYWETRKNGKYWRKPGSIGYISGDELHRVDLEPGKKPLTLVIAGPFKKNPQDLYARDFKTKMGRN